MTTPDNDSTMQHPATEPGTEPAADAAAVLSLEQQLTLRVTELEAKASEASDAYLRAKAEAENTRRRAEEEVSKARKFAVEAFAESLLPVVDSLQAAIAMPEAKVETVLEGVRRAGAQQGGGHRAARGHQVRPAPAPGHQRGAGRARGQHRGGRAAKGLPDQRPGAAPGAGDGDRAEVIPHPAVG